MAQQMGIIRYHGKVGNVVGYVVKGRQLVRKAPEGNGKTKSEAQTRQRSRFGELTALAKAANQWQKRYFPTLKISAYNNVIAYNRDYLHLEESNPSALTLPHTFAHIDASVSSLALSGRTLSFSLALADGASALVVVIVQGKAFGEVVAEGGEKSLEIPADLKKGEKVYVLLQAGKGAELAPSSVFSVDVA